MTNLLVMLLVPVFSTLLAAADLSGVWRLDFDPDFGGHQSTAECTFKHADQKLTGCCGADSPHPTAISGEVSEQKVVFRLTTGLNNEITVTFAAELGDRATTMTGTWHFVDGDGKERTGKFRARRE